MTGVADALEPVVGLEVHVQLLAASKAFCACPARFGDPPNTNTCPTCLGLPGALPVLNDEAVELGLRLALALGCRVGERSVFARKNYFYPDLPKGYQISQHEEPLAGPGGLDIEVGGVVRHVRIERLHLEEDAGKSLHDVRPDKTLLDFNRSGVPLAEIVTRPDLRSGREAHAFLTELRRLVRWLGVSDGNMEEGSLRCDCNVSVREAGAAALGTRVEIKNLNSLRSVGRAIEHEIERQVDSVGRGATIVQGTRSWDEKARASHPLRSKEEARDYRYFPEPDLPPLVVSPERVARVREALPELPWACRRRWVDDLGLGAEEASVLGASRIVAEYFDAVAALCGARPAATWVMGEVLRDVHGRALELDRPGARLPVSPDRLAELIRLVEGGAVSVSAAKRAFGEMSATGEGATAVIERLGLRQVSDEEALTRIVDSVLAQERPAVADWLEGHGRVLGHLMGRVMAASGGQANPRLARSLLLRALERERGDGRDAEA